MHKGVRPGEEMDGYTSTDSSLFFFFERAYPLTYVWCVRRAILARVRSSGYVQMVAVIPAREPATNLRGGESALSGVYIFLNEFFF